MDTFGQLKVLINNALKQMHQRLGHHWPRALGIEENMDHVDLDKVCITSEANIIQTIVVTEFTDTPGSPARQSLVSHVLDRGAHRD